MPSKVYRLECEKKESEQALYLKKVRHRQRATAALNSAVTEANKAYRHAIAQRPKSAIGSIHMATSDLEMALTALRAVVDLEAVVGMAKTS